MTHNSLPPPILQHNPSASRHLYGDWVLTLWSALLWGGLVEKANRTLMPTYGLTAISFSGPKLADVPLLAVGTWALLWLLVWCLGQFGKPSPTASHAEGEHAEPQIESAKSFNSLFIRPRYRALALGIIGAIFLLLANGSGLLSLLLGPIAGAAFVAVQHVLNSFAPFGSGRIRVRLLLTSMLLSMMGIIYLQFLGLLAWIVLQPDL
ncbi:MAG: hypothetical protein ACPGWR_17295 [Ardenticatenaceae bacterium]